MKSLTFLVFWAGLFCNPLDAREPAEQPALNLGLAGVRGVGVTIAVARGVRVNPGITFARSTRDDVVTTGLSRGVRAILTSATIRLLFDVGEGPAQWYVGAGGGVQLSTRRERFTNTGGYTGPVPADTDENLFGVTVTGVLAPPTSASCGISDPFMNDRTGVRPARRCGASEPRAARRRRPESTAR